MAALWLPSGLCQDTPEDVYRLLEDIHAQKDERLLVSSFEQLQSTNEELLASQAFRFHCENPKVVDEGWLLMSLLSQCRPDRLVRAVNNGCDGSDPIRTRVPSQSMIRIAIKMLDPGEVSNSPYRVLAASFSDTDNRNVVRVLLHLDPHKTFDGLWQTLKEPR